MYEVMPYGGWTRTPEEIKKAKQFWYRWKLHSKRLWSATKYGGLDLDILIDFLINRKLTFS
jgi:hypothetical protein